VNLEEFLKLNLMLCGSIRKVLLIYESWVKTWWL